MTSPMGFNYLASYSSPFLEEIGRFVLTFAILENQFDLLYLSINVMRASSGQLTDETREVRSSMSEGIGSKLEQFTSRISELEISEDTQTIAQDFCSRSIILNSKRNDIIHLNWQPSLHRDDTGRGLRVKWQKIKKGKPESVDKLHSDLIFSIEEIQELTAEAEELLVLLFNLQLSDLHAASLAKPR